MFANSEAIDLLTVTQKIKSLGKLDLAGGIPYLTELTTKVNQSAHIESHAAIVKATWVRRKIIESGHLMIEQAYDESLEAFSLLDSSIDAMTQVVKNIEQGKSFDLQSTGHSVIANAMHDPTKSEIIGVPSGILSLDRYTAGWRSGNLIIIAARPSMGKSALVIQIAKNAAVQFKKKVAIFSLEMTADECMQRMLSSHTEIGLSDIIKGRVQGYDAKRLENKADEIINKDIYIDDTGSLTILKLRAKCYVLKNTMGLDLIIVDYLQLMDGPSKLSREQQIAQISRGLKSLAKEFGVPVIALSQLSRKVEERPNKEPHLSDLRESGSIEQDADIVGFLYRPEYYHKHTVPINGVDTNTANLAMLIFEKNRNGPLNRIPLKFIGKFTQFSDWDSIVSDTSQELLDFTAPMSQQDKDPF
jgi:replicative DNA helicase